MFKEGSTQDDETRYSAFKRHTAQMANTEKFVGGHIPADERKVQNVYLDADLSECSVLKLNKELMG